MDAYFKLRWVLFEHKAIFQIEKKKKTALRQHQDGRKAILVRNGKETGMMSHC